MRRFPFVLVAIVLTAMLVPLTPLLALAEEPVHEQGMANMPMMEAMSEMDMSMMGPMLACAHAGVAHGCVHEDMVMAHILGAGVSAMK